MALDVKPIPEGYHTLTPSLVVIDVDKAIEFYGKAFGAQKIARYTCPETGKVMHAEIKIGDSRIMLCEECEKMGCYSPLTLKGNSVTLYVYVENVDYAFDLAVRAGAKVENPLIDQFWGDRGGQLGDPFGHRWFLATRRENLTEEQVAQRAEEFFAATAKTT